ncbi:peptidoglycan D,D-transpeptidase FtsI family protein [Paenibacillus paeoniae]|uniref:Penicillin-binding protein 2 n=1 Tax=Paenibacillus paeoniae TaxID=2292705 RepID=A0A371PMH8_9BACL|nr:penicillin-binding transpeptidase domain-containing protein [Paenibacillus paeoniae]REK76987.1 penicillin-binding protein 2 [Paenibacillus paeoniae]
MSEEQEKKAIALRRQHYFRLNLFFLLVFALFAILIIRLAILQFVEGPTILQQVKDRLGNTPVRIAPIRGNIYDASGEKLAYSTSVQSLYFSIEPGFKTSEADQFAAKLKDIFDRYGDPSKSLTIEQIKESMDLTFRKNTRSVPRRIKAGLTKKEIAYFSENLDEYDGIDIMEESIRHYDSDTVAVQLVGYLKRFKGSKDLSYYKNLVQDNPLLNYIEEEEVGFDGLEYMFQEQLRGKNGLKMIPIDSMGRVIGEPDVTPPVRGNNLHLSINKQIQMKTEEAIMDQLALLKEGGDPRSKNARTGYAVAMEVKTGRIIAMASMPDYDTNIWEGGSISTKELDEVKFFMVNGTIREVYQPIDDDKERGKHPSSIVPLGSTIKPLTVLVGLNEGLITPNTSYNDTGIFQFGKVGIHRKSIRNAENARYGAMDPARAIEKSSNPFMSEKIGNALNIKYRGSEEGVQKWDEYMKMFGLGISTGSGLNELQGTIEYFNEAKTASTQSALIYASFGQQGRYTTLQLAQYTATLASRGKRMKPLFVTEIKDTDGNVVQKFDPVVLNTIDFPDSYWKEIEDGMRQVRVTGFDDFGHTFLRKTGTSEQSVAGGLVENSVFIASAPAENPVLAVAVVVPEGGFGSRGAAPIARKIFDAYDEVYGLNQQ